MKFVNPTRRERGIVLAHALRAHAALEIASRRLVLQVLKRLADGLFELTATTNGGEASARIYLATHGEPAVRVALQRIHAVSAGQFAEPTFGENPIRFGDEIERWRTAFFRYSQTQSFTSAKTISNTVLGHYQKALIDWQASGEGLDVLRRRLQTSIVSPSHAATVARTEVHNAASYSVDSAVRLTHTDLAEKEWGATEDDRTRPTHSDANGQRVPVNSAFDVGGAGMDRPGDPSGPAEEVINCRCFTLYYTG
jgi:hypothetical protein